MQEVEGFLNVRTNVMFLNVTTHGHTPTQKSILLPYIFLICRGNWIIEILKATLVH